MRRKLRTAKNIVLYEHYTTNDVVTGYSVETEDATTSTTFSSLYFDRSKKELAETVWTDYVSRTENSVDVYWVTKTGTERIGRAFNLEECVGLLKQLKDKNGIIEFNTIKEQFVSSNSPEYIKKALSKIFIDRLSL